MKFALLSLSILVSLNIYSSEVDQNKSIYCRFSCDKLFQKGLFGSLTDKLGITNHKINLDQCNKKCGDEYVKACDDFRFRPVTEYSDQELVKDQEKIDKLDSAAKNVNANCAANATSQRNFQFYHCKGIKSDEEWSNCMDYMNSNYIERLRACIKNKEANPQQNQNK